MLIYNISIYKLQYQLLKNSGPKTLVQLLSNKHVFRPKSLRNVSKFRNVKFPQGGWVKICVLILKSPVGLSLPSSRAGDWQPRNWKERGNKN